MHHVGHCQVRQFAGPQTGTLSEVNVKVSTVLERQEDVRMEGIRTEEWIL